MSTKNEKTTIAVTITLDKKVVKAAREEAIKQNRPFSNYLENILMTQLKLSK